MIDQITKNIHFLLLAYALFLGYEHSDMLTSKILAADSELEVQQIKLRKKQKELKGVKKFEANLDQSKKRVQEVLKKIETIQEQLPSDIRDTEVSGKLTEFAMDLKMKNPSPSPKLEVDNKFYISKEYNFDAEGTFLQFLIFYEKLDNLSKGGRILNVKYLRMKPLDKEQSRNGASRFKILSLSTTLEAYRYNKNYNPRDKK